MEEHEPLSSTNHGTLSVISSGLLVNTNPDTSPPNTYQAPPAPLPYDLGLTSSQALARAVDSCGSKNDHIQLANSQTTGETNDTIKTSDCKNKTDCEQNSLWITEDEVSKPIISPTEEDVCPICLEGSILSTYRDHLYHFMLPALEIYEMKGFEIHRFLFYQSKCLMIDSAFKS